jgi:hypothetical protein
MKGNIHVNFGMEWRNSSQCRVQLNTNAWDKASPSISIYRFFFRGYINFCRAKRLKKWDKIPQNLESVFTL